MGVITPETWRPAHASVDSSNDSFLELAVRLSDSWGWIALRSSHIHAIQNKENHSNTLARPRCNILPSSFLPGDIPLTARTAVTYNTHALSLIRPQYVDDLGLFRLSSPLDLVAYPVRPADTGLAPIRAGQGN